jgi:hypothetical protein
VRAELVHRNVVRYYSAWIEAANPCRARSDGGEDLEDRSSLWSDGSAFESEDEDSLYGSSNGSALCFGAGAPRSSPSRLFLFIQMELCPLTLKDFMKQSALHRHWTATAPAAGTTAGATAAAEAAAEATAEAKTQLWDLFGQLMAGMSFLHSRHIVHRYLFPSGASPPCLPLLSHVSDKLGRALTPPPPPSAALCSVAVIRAAGISSRQTFLSLRRGTPRSEIWVWHAA